ncbi:MAG: putative lipid II flippase FtsW [Candidatus Pacebacteria bacterium]|nr:putative lipid II flippase FtsW [Candidatus Paceibacterota bacterium]NUQ57410.1 cell division protein FtsW [Candidatus Paceibacter sp.]
MKKKNSIDKWLFWTVCVLLAAGFFILISASLGMMTRTSGAEFSDIVRQQAFFGLGIGGVLFLLAVKMNYKLLTRFSLFIFAAGVVLSFLVFVPQLGFSHGGARRWIKYGPIFFQPSEILKFGLVIYFSALISSKKHPIGDFKKGFIPFLAVSAVASLPVVLQKDVGTLSVMLASSLGLFFLGGGKWKHFLIALAVVALSLGVLIKTEPYRMSRMTVFLNPEHDPQGAGYQLRQSLIAIGSGGAFGKGFGMSAQKFNYLPEPVNDSIFAVFAEEFGFLGGVLLIGAFAFFAQRGFMVSAAAPDDFSRLLAGGIVIMITAQTFINIAAMVGLFPLTGVPLVFVSKGGTALMMALAEVGVLLNISRFRRR